MIYGFDTENSQDGRLLVACACSRKHRYVLDAGPGPRLEMHRVWMLEAQISTVHVWSVNLEYDLINFYGATLPDFLVPQFGRSRIVGAKMRGVKVNFYEVGRFIPRKSVEEIGDLLRYLKLNVDLETVKDGSVDRKVLARYCMRDAQIARKAGESVESELIAVGVTL